MAEPTTALATLDDYQSAGGYNVLHPVTIGGDRAASPVLVESVAVVRIDPSRGSPDVYHDFRFANERDGKSALSALGLAKIAAAAGVKWVPDLTGVLERQRRDDGHVYIRYRAAGAVRMPNGEWHVEQAEKEIDTADVADQLRAEDQRAVEQGRKSWTPAEIEARVMTRLLQLRQHVLSHAETKAKNRVIRRLLTLKQVYTNAELARPFAVPRLVYRPDVTDPQQIERVQIEGDRAAAALYGDRQRVSDAAQGENAAAGPADTGQTSPAGEDDDPGSQPAGDPSDPQPDEPADDPPIEGGPHDGKRFSEVLAEAPDYLTQIADGKIRADAKAVDLARQWLAWGQPTIGGDQ